MQNKIFEQNREKINKASRLLIDKINHLNLSNISLSDYYKRYFFAGEQKLVNTVNKYKNILLNAQ